LHKKQLEVFTYFRSAVLEANVLGDKSLSVANYDTSVNVLLAQKVN